MREKVVWVVLIILMLVAQGVVYQQFLRLTENGLRVIFERGELADLVKICAAVGSIFVFRGIMSYIIPRVAAWMSADAINKMRRDMTAKLVSLDLTYYEGSTTGAILQRLAGFTGGLGKFIGQRLIKALRDIFTIIIVSGWLLYQQPLLFGSALVVIPVLFFAIHLLSNQVKPLQKTAQKLGAQYTTSIDEMITGVRTVKITNQEKAESTRLQKVADTLRDNSISLQARQAMVMPALDFASAFVYMLVIGAGGYMVLSPDFDVDGASIITFLLGLVLVFDPGRRLAQFFVAVQQQLVTLEEVRTVFDQTPLIVDAPDAKDDFEPTGDIEFKDVSFRYVADLPLFEGLNLQFEGGKTTAIVGATGSGKTTILSLLARLYELESGQVLIGGEDVSKLKVSALRDALSVVAQDIVIFNASIEDNIAYVRPDATPEEITAAAEAAELSDLIAERGDAPVGPKGARLSGGQKQRIAIARAFLRAAPILILDEATSALDQRTEERVQEALGRLSNGRTTIMVAHRLSSVVSADKIFVLEQGRVVETGNHETLMAAGGLYATLFGAQKRGYDPLGATPTRIKR